MTELSRNLLAAAREGLAPGDDVAARVRARVAAAVGAPVAATVAVKAGASEAAATGSVPVMSAAVPVRVATATSTGTLVAGAVLAVAIAVVVALVLARGGDAPAVPQLVPSMAVADEMSTEHRAASAHVSAPPPAASNAATAREAATARPAAPIIASSTGTEAAGDVSLAREVELIDRAMLALRTHDPRAALDAVGELERETRGRGQLAEDAAAIAIEAHCALGHDADARLAAFDRRWPRSAQRARLVDACR